MFKSKLFLTIITIICKRMKGMLFSDDQAAQVKKHLELLGAHIISARQIAQASIDIKYMVAGRKSAK